MTCNIFLRLEVLQDTAEEAGLEIEEPVSAKTDKKKKQKERDLKRQEAEQERQRKAQLEMLLLDDSALQLEGKWTKLSFPGKYLCLTCAHIPAAFSVQAHGRLPYWP